MTGNFDIFVKHRNSNVDEGNGKYADSFINEGKLNFQKLTEQTLNIAWTW